MTNSRQKNYGMNKTNSQTIRRPTQRRRLLQNAIEKTTGIPLRMLNVIEGSMDQRKNHPLLKDFIERNILPSSSKIISRLLSTPMQKKAQSKTENLFTEYRVSLKSSHGKVEIVAAMRLFRKKQFWGSPMSRGVIRVRYIITKGESIHEYRQDFILSGKQFLQSKHSALDYSRNLPKTWREKLNPSLIAPPKTVVM